MAHIDTGHRWTTEELSDFLRRWTAGDSGQSIAAHFGLASGKDLGFGLDNDSAACWCASGAVYVSCERDYAADGEALNLLMAASPTGTIAEFNDSEETTHADVLAWFDRAIALAATPRAVSGDKS